MAPAPPGVMNLTIISLSIADRVMEVFINDLFKVPPFGVSPFDLCSNLSF